MNKMVNFHIGIHYDGSAYISADIEVPGLGKVVIKDCVSKKTISMIEKEVLFALDQKLGRQK